MRSLGPYRVAPSVDDESDAWRPSEDLAFAAAMIGLFGFSGLVVAIMLAPALWYCPEVAAVLIGASSAMLLFGAVVSRFER